MRREGKEKKGEVPRAVRSGSRLNSFLILPLLASFTQGSEQESTKPVGTNRYEWGPYENDDQSVGLGLAGIGGNCIGTRERGS